MGSYDADRKRSAAVTVATRAHSPEQAVAMLSVFYTNKRTRREFGFTELWVACCALMETPLI
jgi:hypothetical protein